MGDESKATRMLREYLVEHDAACPSCRYNLRDLTADRCPECNQALVLQVGLVEPRLAAFTTGLVGIACGLGFCGLLSIYAIYWWFFARRGGMPPLFASLFVGTAVSAVVLLVWLRSRGRIGRMTFAARWALVAVVSAISLVCPAVFILFVR